MPKRVMVVVGEASGDLHGARLVRALLERDPTLEIFGVAGEEMRRERIEAIFDVAHLTGMGLTELVGRLGTLWRAYRLLQRALREKRPDLLILVDFPEFNLRLARSAKEMGIPVLYYISPQIWAWRKGRIRKIARSVDRMAVVFPFEVPFYQSEGVKVSFVGHPLLDVVRPTQTREATLMQYGLEPLKPTIALLPGSRKREISYHLPTLLRAAQQLREKMGAQFILVRATTVERRDLEEEMAKAAVTFPIAERDVYNALNASDLVWVASGTATLETALMLRPMIIVYRLSWLTYGLARLLVRVKQIGMVNIIAGETVVPELVQSDFTAEAVVRESRKILQDAERRGRIIEKLAQVRDKLGSSGAAGRAAEIALSMIAGSEGNSTAACQ